MEGEDKEKKIKLIFNNENPKLITLKKTSQKEIENQKESPKIDIENIDGLTYLKKIKDNSINLILTDPPYIISKDSGMNNLYNLVKSNIENDIEYVKTEEEWNEYKKTLKKPKKELDMNKGKGWSKENYLKYGTILGKKYCNKTDYGEWDSNFTIEELDNFVKEYYNKLVNGGTLILWFDMWKITTLVEIFTKYKFKQLRIIEWVKTNPQPINSKINYLSNCKEYAILGVKVGKPTFNSSYNKGIYEYPMANGKNKFHPTQKNLDLFIKLIQIHSNENDTILDTFLGGGTTAIACKKTNRNFNGCEINKVYVDKVKEIIDKIENGK
jgi:site-specific DNA-methyltransferase (adenine-specific)